MSLHVSAPSFFLERFLVFFFLMWTIFKVFIECIAILLLFYIFGFYGHNA